LIPIGVRAIWSARILNKCLDFQPSFYSVFHNHGMLSVSNRPQWRVIKGGSEAYVKKLTAEFVDRIKVNTPIEAVTRYQDKVMVKPQGSIEEKFDWVFFACHSDQALRLLTDPTKDEQSILSALPYQNNQIVLHTDAKLMPKSQLAWAAWNYHLTQKPIGLAAVTYNMNILQSLESPEPFLVTLNHTAGIDPAKVIKRLNYSHPIFTAEGIVAQSKHAAISRINRTAYAGAYWRNGFHEDGVVSALTALQHFEDAQAKVIA